MADEQLTSLRKAAILMVALGPQVSSKIMSLLSKEEQLLEKVVQEITEMETVAPEIEQEVLSEFETLLRAGEYVLEGGEQFARQMLATSLGQKRADEMLGKITGVMNAGFTLLKDTDPATIWTIIRKEHPQTIAIILSQLDATQAAQVMALMGEDQQSEVVTRIAGMERVDPAIIRDLEESLKNALAGQLSTAGAQSGGPEKAATILNLAGRLAQKNVFKTLDIQNPELSQQIKGRMFTFNDIATALDGRGIQRLLSEVDAKEIAKALKVCDPLLKEKILANMSSRGREVLMEEIQYMPPIRVSEVEEVQNRIVQIVNQLEEAGEINVMRSGSGQEEQFV